MDNILRDNQNTPNYENCRTKLVRAEDGTESKHFPLMCDFLPAEFRIKARNELNETEENITNGLKKLKQFIIREKLPLSSDDNFLMQYLRPSKFNFKKAEENLKRFCLLQQKVKMFLESTEMKRIENLIDCQAAGLLSYRDSQGRAIVYSRGDAWRKELFSEYDVGGCIVCLILFASKLPLTSVCGINYVIDAKVKAAFDLVRIGVVFNFYRPIMAAMTNRVQRVDVLNENYMCRSFYMAFRRLLPVKLSKRIFLHGSHFEAFHMAYPPAMLPVEFGGTAGPLSNESYRDEFLKFVRNLKSELCHQER